MTDQELVHPSYDRLLYLASKLQGQCPHPQKTIANLIPRYELIRSLANNGMVYTLSYYGISEEFLIAKIRRGKNYSGTGDTNEFRKIAALLAYQQIERDVNLSTDQKMSIAGELSRYRTSNEMGLLETIEVPFIPSADHIDEMGFWKTGIWPIDETVEIPDGGLAVIYAMSGAGKTSLMLAMANSIKKAVDPPIRVVYFTLEMMHWAIYRRTKFLLNFDEEDRIVVGGTMDMLEDYCDPNTVIFLDYADLLQYPGVSEVNQKVNAIYEELRRLSLRCKGIITASQIRKADTEITLNSGLNSSAKAHYPDIIWSLRKDDEGGYTEIGVLKNRFGKSGVKRMLRFNYETLDIQDIGMVQLNELDEDFDDL